MTFPGSGPAEAIAHAQRQLEIADREMGDASYELRRAQALDWESPAAALFRRWLADLAHSASTATTQLEEARRAAAAS